MNDNITAIEIAGRLFATPPKPISLRYFIQLNLPETEVMLRDQRNSIFEIFQEVQSNIESLAKISLNHAAEWLFKKALFSVDAGELRAIATSNNCEYMVYDLFIAKNAPMGEHTYDCDLTISFSTPPGVESFRVYPACSMSFAMTAVEVRPQ